MLLSLQNFLLSESDVTICCTAVDYFMQQIDPCSYRRVFGESLDGDMLSAILEMLKSFYIRFAVF